MADGHAIFINTRGGGCSMVDGDIQEEEVLWAVVKEGSLENVSINVRRFSGSSDSSSFSSSTPRVMIPRASTNGVHNLEAKMGYPASAPLSIPADWSKLNRKNSKEGNDEVSWLDDNGDGEEDCHGFNDDDDDDDDDEVMVPPHEYVARKLARSQITSFSMCEGIGRTLKGRDLSRLRNAILTKTGFLE